MGGRVDGWASGWVGGWVGRGLGGWVGRWVDGCVTRTATSTTVVELVRFSFCLVTVRRGRCGPIASVLRKFPSFSFFVCCCMCAVCFCFSSCSGLRNVSACFLLPRDAITTTTTTTTTATATTAATTTAFVVSGDRPKGAWHRPPNRDESRMYQE